MQTLSPETRWRMQTLSPEARRRMQTLSSETRRRMQTLSPETRRRMWALSPTPRLRLSARPSWFWLLYMPAAGGLPPYLAVRHAGCLQSTRARRLLLRLPLCPGRRLFRQEQSAALPAAERRDRVVPFLRMHPTGRLQKEVRTDALADGKAGPALRILTGTRF